MNRPLQRSNEPGSASVSNCVTCPALFGVTAGAIFA
jgi:hypothetical protein